MNKTKKLFIGMIVLTMCFGLAGAGCSATQAVALETSSTPEITAAPTPEPTPEPTVSTTTPEPAPTPEPTPGYRKLGAQDARAFVVLIKNSIGQEITGVAVKTSGEKEYSGNIVPEGQPILRDETLEFYYMPSNAAGDAETLSIDPDDPDTAVTISVSYDIRLTCADENVVVLYNFGFGDITEAELLLEDGVAFVKYVSRATGETVSTKEAQLAEKAKQEEQAAKKTEKKKAKPAQRVDECLDENIAWN